MPHLILDTTKRVLHGAPREHHHRILDEHPRDHRGVRSPEQRGELAVRVVGAFDGARGAPL